MLPSAMASPFPKSSSAAGEGLIKARLLPNGDAGLETMTFQYPLKLISPARPSERRSALVFVLSYGGGLVGGDSVSLSVLVEAGARLSMVTQGHTKIFRAAAPDMVTRQTLQARVAAGAALCLLPDPGAAVRGQRVPADAGLPAGRRRVAVSAGLGHAGPHGARRELEPREVARAATRSGPWPRTRTATGRQARPPQSGCWSGTPSSSTASTPRPTRRRCQTPCTAWCVLGTLILRGPRVRALGDFFLAEFAALPRLGARDFGTADGEPPSAHETWRAGRLKTEKEGGVVWSAASVRGCVVVKFGAAAVEAGRTWIWAMIQREGSVPETFGDHAVMCIR